MRKLGAAEDKVEFLKQIPVHPRNRLRKATKEQQEEVEFIKKVSVHPRDRLKKATKQKAPIHPRNRLKELDKNLKHPKDRMKNKEDKISREKVRALMRGEFSFDPKKLLNKILLFDQKEQMKK